MIRPVRSVVLLPLPVMLGACASVQPGMPPRVLTKLGEPASIRVGTDEHAIEVQVSTRREGADVRVDAVLTETGVAEPRMGTAVAKVEAHAP